MFGHGCRARPYHALRAGRLWIQLSVDAGVGDGPSPTPGGGAAGLCTRVGAFSAFKSVTHTEYILMR